MCQLGFGKNSVCTVSFLDPTSTASRRPIGGFARSVTSVPFHTATALRLGSRLDLPDALAREAEDFADVAERELVILQDSVAQLENRLFLERQLLDGALYRALLPQRLQMREAARVDLRSHSGREIAELIPEALRRLLVRVCVQEQCGKLAFVHREFLADLRGRRRQQAGDALGQPVQELRDLNDTLRNVVADAVTQGQHKPLFRRKL